jgi:hypothetical protein
MKKLLCLFVVLQLAACGKKEVVSREIRTYHPNGQLKSIANYQGDPKAKYVHHSGLQFLETYEIDEIAGQLAQSGIYGFMTAGNGAVIGYVSLKGKRDIGNLMDKPAFRKAFPADLKFLWGAEMSVEPGGPKEQRYLLYAVKIPQGGEAKVNGQDLAEATAIGEKEKVQLKMTQSGAEKFHRLTEANVGRYIAISIDDLVYSAPLVQEAISGGTVEISGDFSEVAVQKLVDQLNAEVLNGEFRSFDEQGKLLQVRQYIQGERQGPGQKK